MVGALTRPRGHADDRARDLLLLGTLPGVGPARLLRLVQAFGGASSALRAPAAAFATVAGSKAARARSDRSVADQVDQALECADRMGMTVLTWGSSAYPEDLLHLADPPALLFLRGRLELLTRQPAITVVGSRRVTTRGREVARTMGRALAEGGAVVVSGLALGTDGEAHRGALDSEGDTIAVLGAGADVPYRRTHTRLFDAIAERGLLVSEFAPGTRAAPYHFPRRNRVLAALGRAGVVVVEAGARSGSLITVDHALDLGRDVWVVPGPINGPACAGSNGLLADGTHPLVSIDTFVAELGANTVEQTYAATVAPIAVNPEVTRGDRHEPAEAVLRHLAEEALAPVEIASRCGCSVPDMLATLTSLELRGRVVRLPGLRYRRAA